MRDRDGHCGHTPAPTPLMTQLTMVLMSTPAHTLLHETASLLMMTTLNWRRWTCLKIMLACSTATTLHRRHSRVQAMFHMLTPTHLSSPTPIMPRRGHLPTRHLVAFDAAAQGSSCGNLASEVSAVLSKIRDPALPAAHALSVTCSFRDVPRRRRV